MLKNSIPTTIIFTNMSAITALKNAINNDINNITNIELLMEWEPTVDPKSIKI